MAATKLSMDWSGVSYTPAGGTLTSITNVTDIDFDSKGTAKKFFGDASRYPKAIAVVEMSRTVKLMSGDVAVLQGIAIGTTLTLVATLNDLKNAAGAGAITYTLVNAVVVSTSGKGKVNDYGMGELTLEAYSSNGTDDPLSFVVA